MKRWGLTFSSLRQNHIEAFVRYPEEKEVKPQTSSAYRTGLIPYLECLFDAGYLKFDPVVFRKHPPAKPLPKYATRFLKYQSTRLKKSSCDGYRGSLRFFYRWLDENKLSIKELKRSDIISWLDSLNKGNNSASTRRARIIHIRIHFYFLNEQGVLKTAFNRLIKTSDIPKLPEYLPRPLPPLADRELQKRFEKSNCKYHKGLLLMRRTGLRVGELISLEQNCVRIDPKGKAFLKVPLGKLDNERLVPLDDRAWRVAKELQEIDSHREKIFLIERKGPKRKTYYEPYSKAIRDAAKGLETDGKITTHRLRHTFATTLLNGGMSLVGLMKLMGHRSYKMTLRYAAVTQETIGKQYFEALERIQSEYKFRHSNILSKKSFDPNKAIDDLIRWIQNQPGDNKIHAHHTKSLVKRARRLKEAIIPLEHQSHQSKTGQLTG